MPYTTLTLDVAHKRLRERWDGSPFWTALDAYDAIRVAFQTWQAATGYWVTRVVVPASPGDPFVPVPGLEQVTAVRWQGIPLLPTTIAELDYMRPSWRADVLGAPGVPPRPWYWAPVGLTTMAVWPAAVTLSAFDIDGLGPIPMPAFQQGGATLDLAEEHVGVLLDFAAWWGAGKAPPAEQDKYQVGLARFSEAVAVYLGDAALTRPLQAWGLQGKELRAPQRQPPAPPEAPA